MSGKVFLHKKKWM